MGKYDKYICTELKKRHMLPGPTPEERDNIAAEGLRLGMEHLLWIDDEVIPGAYYSESTWIWPNSYPHVLPWAEAMKRSVNDTPMFPHAHEFPELLSWWGSDPDRPEETSGMGMIMGDEEIPLPKSWVAYIPAGMIHMPTRPPGSKVTSLPVLHWTSGPGVYTREGDERPDSAAAAKHEQAVVTQRKAGEQKNSRYIVYGYKPGIKRPAYMRELDPRYSRPIAYIDRQVIPDAEFGCDTWWLLPGEKSKAGQQLMDAHTLPHGTSIVFSSLNYDDITDLCAEVELWIGGEKHVINKSFGAYIPPEVSQGPVTIRNITKQIFFMVSQPVGEGVGKYRGR